MFPNQVPFVRFQRTKVSGTVFASDPDTFMNGGHVVFQVSFVSVAA